jgi:hypothetical protein
MLACNDGEQRIDQRLAGLDDGLTNRRQRWVEILGEFDVIVPDHADVTWHEQSIFAQGADAAHGQ